MHMCKPIDLGTNAHTLHTTHMHTHLHTHACRHTLAHMHAHTHTYTTHMHTHHTHTHTHTHTHKHTNQIRSQELNLHTPMPGAADEISTRRYSDAIVCSKSEAVVVINDYWWLHICSFLLLLISTHIHVILSLLLPGIPIPSTQWTRDDVKHVAAGIDPIFRQVRVVVPKDIIQHFQCLGQNLCTEEFCRVVHQYLRDSDADGLKIVGRNVTRFTSTIAGAEELRVRDCPEAPTGTALLIQHPALDLQQELVIEKEHDSTLPVLPVHREIT